MPAHKMTMRYEARQRLKDAVVVRRSLVRRPSGTRTVEDVVAQYRNMSVAQTVATALNDARPAEVYFSKES